MGIFVNGCIVGFPKADQSVAKPFGLTKKKTTQPNATAIDDHRMHAKENQDSAATKEYQSIWAVEHQQNSSAIEKDRAILLAEAPENTSATEDQQNISAVGGLVLYQECTGIEASGT